MKNIALLLLCFSSFSFAAEGMKAVPAPERSCAKSEAEHCYEWALVAAPEIRFVAEGFEDGIEYSFFQRSPSGHYQLLFRVHPVITDASGQSGFYWGYPWDISDIAVSGSGAALRLKATLNHGFKVEGEVTVPKEQLAVPAVLFFGKTTQPAMAVPSFPFRSFSIEALAKAVGPNHSFKADAAPTAQ